MELKPTKAQILWLAEKYNTVPLSTTLPATVTPTQVLQKLKTVSRYRALVPAGIRFVSESGITTPADIEVLRQNGTDAALIGEALMRAPNRRAAVEALLR